MPSSEGLQRTMKIWLDDIRPAPTGYIWCKSVNQAINEIETHELMVRKSGHNFYQVDLIDCDHDLGDYASDGGDGIQLLNWLEATNRNYPIRLHTMNIVGRMNMQAVIDHNGWVEVT